MKAHFKNELKMDDAAARSLAKQALSEFRSSGSKAITRTSEFCDEEPEVSCNR